MNKPTITMLSFDTATASSGVAVWKNGVLKKSFCLTTPKNSIYKEHDMIGLLVSTIIKYKPDIVVCEDLNIVNNISVAKKLSALIGSLEGVCVCTGAYFDKIPASSWRKWITSDIKPPRKREEAKLWDIERVKEIFNITPANDDEADAILIGEAYKRMCNQMEE